MQLRPKACFARPCIPGDPGLFQAPCCAARVREKLSVSSSGGGGAVVLKQDLGSGRRESIWVPPPCYSSGGGERGAGESTSLSRNRVNFSTFFEPFKWQNIVKYTSKIELTLNALGISSK